MDILGIVGIPAIAVLCYVAGAFLKAWDVFDDRKIPVAVLIIGVILGGVAFYFVPVLSVAKDIITALAVGAVSGAMATWVDQLIKQSQKEKGE